MTTSAQTNQNHQANMSKGLDPSNWDFKMDNLREFKKKFTSYCQACFRTKGKSIQKSSFKNEKDLTFMHCYKCKISSHLSCYGMDTPFYKETLADGEVVNIFLCDKCRLVDPAVEEACQVCKLTEGGFKRCDDGTWVHVVCALFSDGYNISNFEKLEIKRVAPMNKDHAAEKKTRRQQPMCEYCNTTGASSLVKCDEPTCHKHSHVYCILKSRANQARKKNKTEDGLPGAAWQFILNINDEILEKKEKARGKALPQYRLKTKRIEDYVEKISKALDDPNLTPRKGEESAVKKRRGGGKKSLSSKGEVAFSTQVLGKIKTNEMHIFGMVEGNEEEGLEETEFKKTLGKRIFVRCASHHSPLKYCKCSSSSGNEGDAGWIACDFCGNCFWD